MMHGKAIWKHRIVVIAKAFMGIAPGPHKGVGVGVEGLQCLIYEPPVAMTMCWCMLGYPYGHKTYYFVKNGGQQKCLDKTLHMVRDFVGVTGKAYIAYANTLQ